MTGEMTEALMTGEMTEAIMIVLGIAVAIEGSTIEAIMSVVVFKETEEESKVLMIAEITKTSIAVGEIKGPETVGDTEEEIKDLMIVEETEVMIVVAETLATEVAGMTAVDMVLTLLNGTKSMNVIQVSTGAELLFLSQHPKVIYPKNIIPVTNKV
jgi:hypothetical protein